MHCTFPSINKEYSEIRYEKRRIKFERGYGNMNTQGRFAYSQEEKDWSLVCDYIRSKEDISDISMRKWIESLEYMGAEGNCMYIRYKDAPEYPKACVWFIKAKYGTVLLEACNHCFGSDYTEIEILY